MFSISALCNQEKKQISVDMGFYIQMTSVRVTSWVHFALVVS